MPLSRHSVGTYPETAHTQLVREHLATVVSARWATVNWSWHKERNPRARANLHLKQKQNKTHRWGMNSRTFSPNPPKRGKSHHQQHYQWVPGAVNMNYFVWTFSSAIYTFLAIHRWDWSYEHFQSALHQPECKNGWGYFVLSHVNILIILCILAEVGPIENIWIAKPSLLLQARKKTDNLARFWWEASTDELIRLADIDFLFLSLHPPPPPCLPHFCCCSHPRILSLVLTKSVCRSFPDFTIWTLFPGLFVRFWCVCVCVLACACVLACVVRVGVCVCVCFCIVFFRCGLRSHNHGGVVKHLLHRSAGVGRVLPGQLADFRPAVGLVRQYLEHWPLFLRVPER